MVGWGCANWVSGWGSVECCGRIEGIRINKKKFSFDLLTNKEINFSYLFKILVC